MIVTVQFPSAAERRVVEECMAEIASAFCAIEPLSETAFRELYWRQHQVSQTEDSILLRKAFTDPAYPRKFDAALKAKWRHFLPLVIH